MDKTALLALFEPKVVDVDIPGIGALHLRELSAPEVSDAREACKDEKKVDFGLRLIIKSVVDEAGEPMFTLADLDSLRNASQRSMGDLVTRVMEINGFSIKDSAAKN